MKIVCSFLHLHRNPNSCTVPVLTAEAHLKDIVQNLYNLIVQSYDHHGSKTQEAMKREM
jgi:hypothetical protein